MGWMCGFANKLISPSPLESPLLPPLALSSGSSPKIRLSPTSISCPHLAVGCIHAGGGPAPSEEAP